MKKRITLIVFSVLIIAALYVLYCFNYIPHKKYTNADFNIEAYKSNIDKDNDGIDDQTDILNNANNYIKTYLLIVNRSVRYYMIFRFRSSPAGYMDCSTPHS